MRDTSDKKAGRGQVTIDLAPDAVSEIERFAKKYGARGTKKAVLSRLVRWFAHLPEPAKFTVIGWVPDGMDAAFIASIRLLADELESGKPGDLKSVATSAKGGVSRVGG